MEEVAINTETIQLDQFLKWAGAVGSGGQAKEMIAAGLIEVNGAIAAERRKKLRPGDIVSVRGGGEWIIASG